MEPLRNIILQHFNGELRELDKLSVENIKQYAARIGADYKLLGGRPFRSHLSDPCQKAFVIDETWDEYDNVLMLDPDMFVTKNCIINVFNIPGNGTHGPVQIRLKDRLTQLGRITSKGPYWAGSFYKFSKQERLLLRQQMPKNDDWMNLYNQPYFYEDEGILAQLASRANFSQSYIDISWNQCSYLPSPETAHMIHIRTKITPSGPKRLKIDNYRELVDKGIL